MKRAYKKITALLLSLVIILTLTVPVLAVKTYNATAALTYAKQHWNDGKGECAEFVYNCLKAGGCPVQKTTLCSGLRKQLEQLESSGYCTGNWLTVEKSGYISVAKNKDILSPGDPIFYNCPHETDGKPFVHVVLYSGQDSLGRLTCYAHNVPMNNEAARLLNCGSCGKPLSGAYVFHMTGSSGATAPSKPEYFDCNIEISCIKGKTVNLYNNPGDSTRADYFDLGQSVKSTYGAKLDGATWYRVRVKSGSTVKDLWIKYEKGKMTVKNITTTKPVTLSASVTNIALSLEGKKSQTVTLKLGGDVPKACELTASVSNSNVAATSWGDYRGGYTAPVVITAKNTGTCTVTYTARDAETNATLAKVSVNITVSAPSKPQYFDCNVEINCVRGKTVNLYNNPGDNARIDYFDLGQSLRSTYGAKLSDGSTWYRGTVKSGSTVKDVWLKYESNKMSVRDATAPTPKEVTLTVSSADVSLDLKDKKSQTITLQLGGDVPEDCGLHYEMSDSAIASMEWGAYQGGYAAPAVITAKSAGTCTITCSAKNKTTGETLATAVVHVTVALPEYMVRYDANGGTGAPAAQTKTYQKPLVLSSVQPSREGYTFGGWAASAGGSVQYHPGDQYAKDQDVTFYAVWVAAPVAPVVPKEVKLTISASSISLDLDSQKSQTIALAMSGDVLGAYDRVCEISNPDIASSVWDSFNDESLMPVVITAKSVGTCTITYSIRDRVTSEILATVSLAVAVSAPTYTVYYSANGGANAPAPQTKAYQKAISLSAVQPSREGYTFSGWATSPDGSVRYRPGDSYAEDQDVTLYAIWSAIPAKADVTLSASVYSVSLDLGDKKSETIILNLGGDVPEGCRLSCLITNPDVVSSSWGAYKDGYTVPVTIMAQKAGSTTITYAVRDGVTNAVLAKIPIVVVVAKPSPPVEPSGPQYFSCNVKIDCFAGKTVNLYKNPGDTTRVDYFDLGQTMWSTYGVRLADGSTWYQGKVRSLSNVIDVWLKYESNKMSVTNVDV